MLLRKKLLWKLGIQYVPYAEGKTTKRGSPPISPSFRLFFPLSKLDNEPKSSLQEHDQSPKVLREAQGTGGACHASIQYLAKGPLGQFLGTLHWLKTAWGTITDQLRLPLLTALSFPVHHLTARRRT